MAEGLSENLSTVCATLGAVTAVTGLAASYYLTRLPEPNCVPAVDLNDQSYVLPDGSRCSKLLPKGELLKTIHDVETLYGIFQRGLSISENDPCLGERTGKNLAYEWLTYRQIHDRAQSFGSWVLDQGYESGKEQVIGIFSANRTEWVITEQACSTYNLVATALYETLGEDAIAFIINQTSMSIVVCDTTLKVNKLLKIHDQIKSVKTIVVMNEKENVDGMLADKAGINVISFKDAMPPKPDDATLICYTSGKTGNPKGVVLTHGNLMADISAVCFNTKVYREYNKHDVHISYLPLPHLYERLFSQIMYLYGGRVGFFRGDVKLLLDDMQTLKPTIFPAVPRLLNRIYDKILLGVQTSVVKRKLLEWGLASKKKELERFILRKNSFWDKLVFHEIQALLGGRVECIVTGSAPLEAKVLDLIRCAFGCFVFEAYGLTETSTCTNITVVGTVDSGHVGPPAPCNFIKLVDLEEARYFANGNEGEICIKGPNVMRCYFKEPAKTAMALDRDGWFHSGDVGQWLPNGTLKIIDRQKHIFKLSQGEYIAPQKIEIVFMRSLFVAQVFVDGDSLQPYIMAAIVPDVEALIPWAKQNNLPGNFKNICESESVKDMILADINTIGRESGLNGFELAKDIILHSDMFSVDNDLLTPSFKNKIPNLRKCFQKDFAALYKKHQT